MDEATKMLFLQMREMNKRMEEVLIQMRSIRARLERGRRRQPTPILLQRSYMREAKLRKENSKLHKLLSKEFPE